MNFSAVYPDLQTLIIDDMQTQRTTLRGQLQQLQINKVDQATTAEEAIKYCKSKTYGLVLCDFNLNQKSDGQQLFEYLRDNQLLGKSCLFFMVTAENSYLSVASATEHKPDAYLLKPFTASDLSDRLKNLLEKNEALQTIEERLDRQDYAGAITHCDILVKMKSRWTMPALQIKAESLMHMGRYADAREVYAQVLAARSTLVWAQLGMAKAYKAESQFEQAKMMVQNIIDSKEGEKNIDAYDILAECLEATGDMEGAMYVMKDSAAVIPSARRQRLVAEAAYLNGDLETAKECYARLAKATAGSVTSLPQDILAQAQTLVDMGETQEAVQMLDVGMKKYPNDPAFQGVSLAVKSQALSKQGDAAGAEAALAKARGSLRRAKADFGTIALAKAEVMGGNAEAGLKLMSNVVSSDHENQRMKQLIGNVLRSTGHEDKVTDIIEGATKEINSKVDLAKKLLRDGQYDESLEVIEQALRDYPDNTGVLLQAAQLNCLSLRLKKQMNFTISERVRSYLTRLEKLLPESDRVAQMKVYFRDTSAMLNNQGAAKAP